VHQLFVAMIFLSFFWADFGSQRSLPLVPRPGSVVRFMIFEPQFLAGHVVFSMALGLDAADHGHIICLVIAGDAAPYRLD
jgi:hypothetical protein